MVTANISQTLISQVSDTGVNMMFPILLFILGVIGLCLLAKFILYKINKRRLKKWQNR